MCPSPHYLTLSPYTAVICVSKSRIPHPIPIYLSYLCVQVQDTSPYLHIPQLSVCPSPGYLALSPYTSVICVSKSRIPRPISIYLSYLCVQVQDTSPYPHIPQLFVCPSPGYALSPYTSVICVAKSRIPRPISIYLSYLCVQVQDTSPYLHIPQLSVCPSPGYLALSPYTSVICVSKSRIPHPISIYLSYLCVQVQDTSPYLHIPQLSVCPSPGYLTLSPYTSVICVSNTSSIYLSYLCVQVPHPISIYLSYLCVQVQDTSPYPHIPQLSVCPSPGYLALSPYTSVICVSKSRIPRPISIYLSYLCVQVQDTSPYLHIPQLSVCPSPGYLTLSPYTSVICVSKSRIRPISIYLSYLCGQVQDTSPYLHIPQLSVCPSPGYLTLSPYTSVICVPKSRIPRPISIYLSYLCGQVQDTSPYLHIPQLSVCPSPGYLTLSPYTSVICVPKSRIPRPISIYLSYLCGQVQDTSPYLHIPQLSVWPSPGYLALSPYTSVICVAKSRIPRPISIYLSYLYVQVQDTSPYLHIPQLSVCPSPGYFTLSPYTSVICMSKSRIPRPISIYPSYLYVQVQDTSPYLHIPQLSVCPSPGYLTLSPYTSVICVPKSRIPRPIPIYLSYLCVQVQDTSPHLHIPQLSVCPSPGYLTLSPYTSVICVSKSRIPRPISIYLSYLCVQVQDTSPYLHIPQLSVCPSPGYLSYLCVQVQDTSPYPHIPQLFVCPSPGYLSIYPIQVHIPQLSVCPSPGYLTLSPYTSVICVPKSRIPRPISIYLSYLCGQVQDTSPYLHIPQLSVCPSPGYLTLSPYTSVICVPKSRIPRPISIYLSYLCGQVQDTSPYLHIPQLSVWPSPGYLALSPYTSVICVAKSRIPRPISIYLSYLYVQVQDTSPYLHIPQLSVCPSPGYFTLSPYTSVICMSKSRIPRPISIYPSYLYVQVQDTSPYLHIPQLSVSKSRIPRPISIYPSYLYVQVQDTSPYLHIPQLSVCPSPGYLTLSPYTSVICVSKSRIPRPIPIYLSYLCVQVQDTSPYPHIPQLSVCPSPGYLALSPYTSVICVSKSRIPHPISIYLSYLCVQVQDTSPYPHIPQLSVCPSPGYLTLSPYTSVICVSKSRIPRPISIYRSYLCVQVQDTSPYLHIPQLSVCPSPGYLTLSPYTSVICVSKSRIPHPISIYLSYLCVQVQDTSPYLHIPQLSVCPSPGYLALSPYTSVICVSKSRIPRPIPIYLSYLCVQVQDTSPYLHIPQLSVCPSPGYLTLSPYTSVICVSKSRIPRPIPIYLSYLCVQVQDTSPYLHIPQLSVCPSPGYLTLSPYTSVICVSKSRIPHPISIYLSYLCVQVQDTSPYLHIPQLSVCPSPGYLTLSPYTSVICVSKSTLPHPISIYLSYLCVQVQDTSPYLHIPQLSVCPSPGYLALSPYTSVICVSKSTLPHPISIYLSYLCVQVQDTSPYLHIPQLSVCPSPGYLALSPYTAVICVSKSTLPHPISIYLSYLCVQVQDTSPYLHIPQLSVCPSPGYLALSPYTAVICVSKSTLPHPISIYLSYLCVQVQDTSPYLHIPQLSVCPSPGYLALSPYTAVICVSKSRIPHPISIYRSYLCVQVQDTSPYLHIPQLSVCPSPGYLALSPYTAVICVSKSRIRPISIYLSYLCVQVQDTSPYLHIPQLSVCPSPGYLALSPYTSDICVSKSRIPRPISIYLSYLCVQVQDTSPYLHIPQYLCVQVQDTSPYPHIPQLSVCPSPGYLTLSPYTSVICVSKSRIPHPISIYLSYLCVQVQDTSPYPHIPQLSVCPSPGYLTLSPYTSVICMSKSRIPHPIPIYLSYLYVQVQNTSPYPHILQLFVDPSPEYLTLSPYTAVIHVLPVIYIGIFESRCFDGRNLYAILGALPYIWMYSQTSLIRASYPR